jgi:mono/diheme cytochrome c family protein
MNNANGIRAAALGAALAAAFQVTAADKPDDMIQHGRYIVSIAGCNDCHTPDFAMSGGRVAEKHWLTGDALGWRGPWGTTYPTNLRLYMAGISEEEWVKRARTLTTRPPMPWFNVRAMTERDSRALYRFVRSLGPGGKPAPSYVPPDKEPHGPVVSFPPPPPKK